LFADLREQRQSTRWLAVLWALLWAITIATWIYSEEGYSSGMPGPVFFLHLLAFPLVVGYLGSGWRMHSGLAGVVFAEANLLLQLVWGGILAVLGRIAPDPNMTGLAGILEYVEFMLLMGVPGFILGWLGGAVGKAARRRRG